MEAHEQIPCRHTLEVCAFENVSGHRVVDVQQRRRHTRGALQHVFGNGSIQIHLARDRNAAAREAAVDETRHETEFALERRPALVGENAERRRTEVVLVELRQRQFVLRKTRQQLRPLATALEFLGHIGRDRLDAGLVLPRFLEFDQQVQLRGLHHRRSEVVDRLDRRVAGHEIVRTRTEPEHFEVRHADHHPRDRRELANFLREVFRESNRILGNVYFEAAQPNVV